MEVTTLDYVVLGIIFLFCLIGFFRGFIKTLFSICKGFIVFALAYFLCNPAASMIHKANITKPINDKVASWIIERDPAFKEKISADCADVIANHLNFPEFIERYIVEFVTTSEGSLLGTDATLGDVVAVSITNYIVAGIAFLLLLLILGLIVRFIFGLIERIFDAAFLRPMNMITGFFLGGVIGYLVVCVLFSMLSLGVALLPVAQELIESQINPSLNEFGISRFIYNNNLLNILLEKILFNVEG